MPEPAQTPALNTNPPRRKRRRLGWFWYLSLTLLALGMVAGLAWMLWYGTAWAELNSAIAAARERGEKVYFSEFKPPPVPPEQDGWPLVAKAIEQFSKPRAVTSEVIRRDEELDAAFKRARETAKHGDENGEFRFDLPILAEEVAVNSDALALLDHALKFPKWKIPIQYDVANPVFSQHEFESRVSFLLGLKEHVFLLAVNRGDVPAAVGAVRDQLRIAVYYSDLPFEHQLLRIIWTYRAIRCLETLVGRYLLDVGAFALLDEDLQHTLIVNGCFKQAILSERGLVLTSIPEVISDKKMWIFGDKCQYYLAFRRQPQLLRDQAYFVGFVSQLAESIGEQGPDRQAIRELCDPSKVPADNVLATSLCEQYERLLMAGVRHRQSLLNARVGLRVARHYWQNGALPETLDEIVDDKLPKLPVCLYSDKPLVYKKRADGFSIYCLGDNSVDDGGGRGPDEQEGGSAFDVILAPLVRPKLP